MPTSDPQSERLQAAWEKFNARIADVRKKTKNLLTTVDQNKREREMEALRKRIGQS